MLSNDTKLQRINEKLGQIGAKLQWCCYDLKTYTPGLVNLRNYNSVYFVVEGYNLRLRTFVENNKVIFSVNELLIKYPTFTRYSLNKAIKENDLPFFKIGNIFASKGLFIHNLYLRTFFPFLQHIKQLLHCSGLHLFL